MLEVEEARHRRIISEAGAIHEDGDQAGRQERSRRGTEGHGNGAWRAGSLLSDICNLCGRSGCCHCKLEVTGEPMPGERGDMFD